MPVRTFTRAAVGGEMFPLTSPFVEHPISLEGFERERNVLCGWGRPRAGPKPGEPGVDDGVVL
jgi:hypothetical protein